MAVSTKVVLVWIVTVGLMVYGEESCNHVKGCRFYQCLQNYGGCMAKEHPAIETHYFCRRLEDSGRNLDSNV